jgi:hypothetical protein
VAWTGRWWAPLIAAAALLTAAGVGHRVLLARIQYALTQVYPPRQPLATLPLQVEGWSGREVALDPRELQAANFDDEYVSRVYAQAAGSASVAVFVGYVGRPRMHLGHRPDVCYAAHGWEQADQRPIDFKLPDGRRGTAILYSFRRPDDVGRPLLVLAMYVVNGRYVRDPDDLRRWSARSPGLLGERPPYLARMQVSLRSSGDQAADLATLENFTGLMADPLVARLPYWESGS